MKTDVQNVWLKKARSVVACAAFLGTTTPALANSWGGNLPVATSVPLVHTPTSPIHSATQHSSSANASAWSAPNTATSGLGSHLKAVFFPGHTVANASPAHTINHGQPFLTTLPKLPAGMGQSLFSGTSSTGISGPGLQLDLTSTTPTIVLGSGIFQGKQSVTIMLGGASQVFAAGAHVTAAEYVAIRQVLSGKSQSLSLKADGSASGGTFSINSVSSSQVSELVVPAGVTALDYAAKNGGQTIAGDVLNYGTIYGVAGHGQGNTIAINAQDIVNESGGLISTKLTSSMASSLGGVVSPVNLSLSAADDFSNFGTIISSGSIALTAANGSISNIVTAGGGSGAAGGGGAAAIVVPTIQAVHNVTLSTGTGALTNSGLIASTSGNVAINSPLASNDINVNGAGGTIQALKGNIEVRDAAYAGSANINLNGGDYLSKNLNLYSGTGTIDGTVGQLTGVLNTTAGADHLQAATSTLLLGNNTISGDPTFVNSGALSGGIGNIEIVGSNSFSEDVTIIATGDITSDAQGQIIDHGHNVTLVAGAILSNTTGNPDSTTVQGNTTTPPVVSGNTSTAVTIDTSQSNSVGGSIDLTASKATTVIDTSSTTGNAGNVTLVAFGATPTSGGVSVGGNVLLPTTSIINATATGSASGGNVTVIAGGSPAVTTDMTIQVGSIMTGGGSAGGTGGAISLYTAVPTTSNAATSTLITYGTNGSVSSGNTFMPGTTAPSGSVLAGGDLVTAAAGQTGVKAGTAGATGGNITILAGANITTQNLLAFGGGGAGGDSQTNNGGAGGGGGNISLTALGVASGQPGYPSPGSITINGQVNSSGGGGGGAGTNGAASGVGGAGGNAGTIKLLQEGDPEIATQPLFNISGGVYAAQGGAGGSSTASTVGGGGGSYGGGGGGGSSGTGGTGTIGIGGAGGAGFFGGGGADIGGSGGGGGYTAGGAGGTANATAGAASTGGNGVGTTSPAPQGGQLGTGQQGGQGFTIGTGHDGANIPTTTGGNNVTMASTATMTLGGDVYGKSVSISTASALSIPGNIIGTSSVSLSSENGAVSQASTGLSITTPSLTVAVGPSNFTGQSIGASNIPLATNAQTLVVSGSAINTWIVDNATGATTLNAGGLSTDGGLNLSVIMTANNASLNVLSLPSNLINLTLNVGSDASKGGTLNFTSPTINIGIPGTSTAEGQPGTITLVANNLTWTNSQNTPLNINASDTFGSGGTISITANQVNGSSSIALGNTDGQLNLSATASGSNPFTTGGSISIAAPAADLIIGNNSLPVGFTGGAGDSGNGGSISLNVGEIINANNPLILNASGAGSGDGGTISVVTHVSYLQTIGTGNGDIEFVATNGGTDGGVQRPTGGTISFTNIGAGGLAVDQTGIQLTAGSGGTSVNGGSINLSANTVASTSAGPLTLNVDGGMGAGSIGNGGSISITETTSTPTAVTLGSGGQFMLSAQGGMAGGNGGAVSFSTQGALNLTTDATGNVVGTVVGEVVTPNSVMVAPQFTSGSGGSVTLTALSFNNASNSEPLVFNVQGVGAGSGGFVRVNQLYNSSVTGAAITIGKSTGDMEFLATNGATGTRGGTVIVTVANDPLANDSSASIIVDPTAISLLVSSKTDTNISGGFIELVAPVITAADTLALSKAPVILNASGVGTGNGGSIIFQESKATTTPATTPTIGNKVGQFELLATSGKSGGNGGAITVSSGSNLTVIPVGISVKGVGSIAGYNGGSLSLFALNTDNEPGEGNLLVTGALSVTGAGKASGGTINLSSNSTTPFNIGLTKNNANGVEGTLSMAGATDGSLNVTSNGTGGIVVQTAITTPGFVDLIATNATAGDIDINSTIGGTKTNQIIVNAANTNIGGSITGKLVTSTASTKSGTTAVPSGASIELIAADDISASKLVKGTLTPEPLQLSTLNLTASCSNGIVDLNDNISVTASLLIGELTAGQAIILSSSGNIIAQNGMTATNSISLTAKGYVETFTPLNAGQNMAERSLETAEYNATATTPTSGLIQAHLVGIGENNLPAHTGGDNICSSVLNINIKGKADASLESSAAASTALVPAGGVADINSFGTFTITGETNAYTISANTGFVVTGTVGYATGSVTLMTTSPTGSITGSAVLLGKSLTLQTHDGDMGAGGIGNALHINTSSFTALSDGGSAFIDSVGKTNIAVTNTNVSNFYLTTSGSTIVTSLTTSGDANIVSGGATSLSSIISKGSITAVCDGITTIGSLSATGGAADGGISVTNTSGVLQTSANATIVSLNGTITMENEDVKTGSIVINSGSLIATGTSDGVNFGGTGGNVTLTIGPVPTMPVTGIAPQKYLNATATPGNEISYGQNGITTYASKAGMGNTVTAQNANIIFNTSALKAVAIKLEGGTTIVADPPTIVTAGRVEGASAVDSMKNEQGASASVETLPISDQMTLLPALSPSASDSSLAAAMASLTILGPARATLSPPFVPTPALNTVGNGAMSTLTARQNQTEYVSASRSSNLDVDSDSSWISESEISSGLIPATIYCAQEFQYTGRASTVLDMQVIASLNNLRGGSSGPDQIVYSKKHLGDKNILLTKGSVLFASNKDTTVETPLGKIFIAADSIVLIIATNQTLAVFDFHDNHSRSVFVATSNRNLDLMPGRHLLISKNNCSDFASFNVAQLIPFANVKHSELGKNDRGESLYLFSADFDILSAISSVLPLAAIIRTQEAKNHKLKMNLVKTAAIVASLNVNSAQYHQIKKPSLVVFNNTVTQACSP